MTLRYLLDTNIISEPVRPIPNANVMAKLIEAKSTVAIASIVKAGSSAGLLSNA